jgi:hypothetical protein
MKAIIRVLIAVLFFGPVILITAVNVKYHGTDGINFGFYSGLADMVELFGAVVVLILGGMFLAGKLDDLQKAPDFQTGINGLILIVILAVLHHKIVGVLPF